MVHETRVPLNFPLWPLNNYRPPRPPPCPPSPPSAWLEFKLISPNWHEAKLENHQHWKSVVCRGKAAFEHISGDFGRSSCLTTVPRIWFDLKWLTLCPAFAPWSETRLTRHECNTNHPHLLREKRSKASSTEKTWLGDGRCSFWNGGIRQPGWLNADGAVSLVQKGWVVLFFRAQHKYAVGHVDTTMSADVNSTEGFFFFRQYYYCKVKMLWRRTQHSVLPLQRYCNTSQACFFSAVLLWQMCHLLPCHKTLIEIEAIIAARDNQIKFFFMYFYFSD